MTTLYILKQMRTVCFCSKDFYTEGVIKNKGGFFVGAQTGVGVWTSQCDISSTGNITTNGTITGFGLSITGTSGPSSLLTPTVTGVHINNYGGYSHIDLAAPTGCYIDFTHAGADSRARMIYTHSTSTFDWSIGVLLHLKCPLRQGAHTLVQHW